MKTIFFVLASIVAFGCATPPSSPGRSSPPSSRPALSAGDSTAEQLAARIVKNAGYDDLHEVAQLDFAFVVKDDGKTVFEAKHRWDLRNARSRIAWTDKAGDRHEAWLDVDAKTAVGTKNGQLVAGLEAETLTEAAYRRYINDTYWLLMPLKLFDPGTSVEFEDKVTIGGTTYQILRLSFDDVGLTPGDVYRLYIDDGGFRIHGWQMLLQGRKDRPSYVTWEDYKPVGPLLISHRHRVENTKREIVIEGALAHRVVRSNVFVPPSAP